MDDSVAVRFLYQKCMDGIDSSLSHEFRKRIENDMEDGKLTITKLSDAMIRVNKFDRNGLVTPLSSA